MTKSTDMTREQWYMQAAGILFQDHIIPELALNQAPPIRINSGWPKGVRGGAKSKIGGACYPRAASKDDHNEIFMVPTLDDPIKALGILMHEIVHAIDDCRNGHKGPFRKMALALGLTGPMKSTEPGPELHAMLEELVAELPPFPAEPMHNDDSIPKQGTRMIKFECAEGCGFKARASRKVIDNFSPDAQCPCCGAGIIHD